jgi:hypothetical protein
VPYAIRVDEARHVVIVAAAGNIDAATATPMITEARATAAARGFDILYDFRAAIPGDLKTGDVFWFPRRIPALAKAEARRVRIALVYPESQREFARFWETTFQNAGLRARAFDDETAALTWLDEAGA